MQLTQRRINLLVFIWLLSLALLALPIYVFIRQDYFSAAFTGLFILIAAGLLFTYWRGWEYARHAVVLLAAVLVVWGLPDFYLTSATTVTFFIPISMALLLLTPWWIGGIALLQLVLVSVRAGLPNIYLEPVALVIYCSAVGLIVLSRLSVDSALLLEEARVQAETARAEAEAARAEAEERARELEVRSVEQQRLLDLVATLEIPAVEIADRVLLAPLVGSLDTHRLARLSSYLLEEANLRRPELIVLDIGGVILVDTQVTHGLVQIVRGLRLLGCPAILTGISPEVVTTLTGLQVDLSELTTTRSPQDALKLHLKAHTDLFA